MTMTTFFAGRRWVPAHRGAWYVERSDETAFSENLSDENPAAIDAPEALVQEKEQPAANPPEVAPNHRTSA